MGRVCTCPFLDSGFNLMSYSGQCDISRHGGNRFSDVYVCSQYILLCDFHCREEFPPGSHCLFNIGLKIKSE